MVLLKHTHVRPSHPSSVLTQACLSVFPFCQYFVFILPWWYIFTMVYLLIFSNTVLLSCVYANVSISFPYFQTSLIPSTVFGTVFPLVYPFLFLPQVNKQTLQDEGRVGHILLLKQHKSQPTFRSYSVWFPRDELYSPDSASYRSMWILFGMGWCVYKRRFTSTGLSLFLHSFFFFSSTCPGDHEV